MSSLYRTVKENYVPYFSDGNCRDRYICIDNAGFFRNFIPILEKKNPKTMTTFFTKIRKSNRLISSKVPNFHYYSDGSGRDKYILFNGGGLFYENKPLCSYKLTDFLRKNEETSFTPYKKRNIFLSKDQINYNQILRKKEKNLIDRLYYNEKEKFFNSNALFSKRLNTDISEKTGNLFLQKRKNSYEPRYNIRNIKAQFHDNYNHNKFKYILTDNNIKKGKDELEDYAYLLKNKN